MLLMIMIIIFSMGSVLAENGQPMPVEPMPEVSFLTEKARVLEVRPLIEVGGEYYKGQIQPVTLEITSGDYKGEIFEVENGLSENIAYNILVEKGDKVVVSIAEGGISGGPEVNIADYYRGNYLLYLSLIFIVLIILIGRLKGLRALISLIITIAAIIYILLPAILKGMNPVPISIGIAIAVTIITIFLIGGISQKSIAAIIGTSIGVIVAGLISYLVGSQINLTGMSADEATMLIYIPQKIVFDFRNLLFAGIILGALGAIMDVGMSIASSIDEIYKANNQLSVKDLFNSGMNVGKDIMGTMINTLILAYAGTSIPLLLVFMAYETAMTKIVNMDIIATEIVRSLSGSIGLILTIPITAFIASVLIRKGKDKDKKL